MSREIQIHSTRYCLSIPPPSGLRGLWQNSKNGRRRGFLDKTVQTFRQSAHCLLFSRYQYRPVRGKRRDHPENQFGRRSGFGITSRPNRWSARLAFIGPQLSQSLQSLNPHWIQRSPKWIHHPPGLRPVGPPCANPDQCIPGRRSLPRPFWERRSGHRHKLVLAAAG